MPAKIRFLQTYSILAHYIPGLHLIEISSYLKKFPELYAFCLEHEEKHADLQEKKGYSLRHIIIEFKDRLKLFRDPLLCKQLKEFRKRGRAIPKGKLNLLKFIIYKEISLYSMFFSFFITWRSFKAHLKNILSAFMEAV